MGIEGSPKENIKKMREILSGEDTSYRDLNESERADLLTALRQVAPDKVHHRIEGNADGEILTSLKERGNALKLNLASQTDADGIKEIKNELEEVRRIIKNLKQEH